MFDEVWELERFQTAKVTFKFIQGDWQWCHSIDHIRFPIRLHCNHVSILHRFRDIITRLTQPSTLRGTVKWVPAKRRWCSVAGQAWYNLQVKLCDPCLSALEVDKTMRYTNQHILYFTYFPKFNEVMW